MAESAASFWRKTGYLSNPCRKRALQQKRSGQKWSNVCLRSVVLRMDFWSTCFVPVYLCCQAKRPQQPLLQCGPRRVRKLSRKRHEIRIMFARNFHSRCSGCLEFAFITIHHGLFAECLHYFFIYIFIGIDRFGTRLKYFQIFCGNVIVELSRAFHQNFIFQKNRLTCTVVAIFSSWLCNS